MDLEIGRKITIDLSNLEITATGLFSGLKDLSDNLNSDFPEARPKIEQAIIKQREFADSLADLCGYLYPAIREKVLEASLPDST
jgi:hypothetical protein